MSSTSPPDGPGPFPTGSFPTGSFPTDPSRSPGQEASSNLYLVTFLATLFLLLFVSCGIVLRSYILRRRYQRRLEEALGSGLLLAPRAQGSKKKRLGTKPKIINTWLTEGGEKWNQMMPLSAQPVFVKRKIRENPAVQQTTTNDTTTIQPSTVLTTAGDPSNLSCPQTGPTSSGHNRMTNLFTRFRRQSLHDVEELVHTNANGEKQAPGPNYKIRVEMLQLSVFISMPSPHRSQKKHQILENTDPDRDEEEADDEDPELPNMVFGVTRVNYRQPKSTQSPTLPPLPTPTMHQSDMVVS
ncbi:hypothetical protein BYT27DRAFT_7247596 [Phlegmacium glaucopus]|nr:hypothetical protein BYT27DRAFT_7247596 [Phlegmacium glaucopus]